jgi:hypothetical protein
MKKTKLIILAGGFGGVYTVLRLDKTLARRADVEVTLASSDNFLRFTLMLHEVAAGDLNPSDIVNPIRPMLKRVQFVQAEVRSIDLTATRVQCTHASPKPGPRHCLCRRRLWFKVSSFFLVAALLALGRRPYFGNCRHSGRPPSSLSAILESTLFNFATYRCSQ